jgi:hypothetical protein
MKGTGNCRVGWSTRLAHLDLGKDKLGFGYGAKGFKSYEGAYDKYGEEYTNGDVIGCLLDLSNCTVQFSKNGILFEIAYNISPDILGSVFFPTFTLSGSSVEVNFGRQSMQYLPTGFTAINQALCDVLYGSDAMEAYSIRGKCKPLAIILEPTRDLAEQVYQTFIDLSRHINNPSIKSALLIGDDPRTNSKKLLADGVDIVIGTIGKITGVLANKQLDLSYVRFFVLDEADRLTSMNNLSAVKYIFQHCPKSGTGCNRLQVLQYITHS